MIEPKKNSREYGLLQERRIIDALRRQPMTEYEMADMFKVVRNTITVYMTRMRRENRVHVARYIKNPTGRPRPVFAAGAGVDAEYVVVRYRSKVKQPDRIAATRERLLQLLETPHTVEQLTTILHLSASVVRARVRDLRLEKKVRISGWRHAGSRNGWAPAYKVGSEADKKRPKPLTAAQYSARKRKDDERREHEQNLRRVRDQMRKLRDKPAGWAATLGV